MLSFSRKLLYLLCILLFTQVPVFAHSPYAIKYKSFKDPSGNAVVLEKLYGDGIITTDPVSVQLRNKHDAIVAHTQTSSFASIFCNTLKNCVVYPYDTFSLFATPYILDFENLNFLKELASTSQSEIRNTKTSETPATRLQYPEYRKGMIGFTKAPALYALSSPLMIIKNHSLFYLIVLALSFFIHVITEAYRVWLEKSDDAILKVGRIIGWLVSIGVYSALSIFGFLIMITWALPVFYSLLFFISGTLLGNKALKLIYKT